MQKIHFSCIVGCALLIAAQDSTAQLNARVGLKLGGDFTMGVIEHYSSIAPISDNTKRFGFYGGGFVELSGKKKSSKFKTQVELLYSYSCFDFPDATAKNNMLSIPIVAKYFFSPKFSVAIGPSINLNSEKWSFHNDGSSDFSRFKRAQIGGLLDVTYYLYKGLFVQARYNMYFGNTLVYQSSSLKYSDIQFGIGYKFR